MTNSVHLYVWHDYIRMITVRKRPYVSRVARRKLPKFCHFSHFGHCSFKSNRISSKKATHTHITDISNWTAKKSSKGKAIPTKLFWHWMDILPTRTTKSNSVRDIFTLTCEKKRMDYHSSKHLKQKLNHPFRLTTLTWARSHLSRIGTMCKFMDNRLG